MRLRLPARLTAGLVVMTGTLAAGGVPAARAAAPCSWPMYQHDAARTGAAGDCATISPASAPTLGPRWFFPTGGAVTASPAVAGGNVYVGDGNGTFYAIDAATGAEKWSFDVTKTDHHAVSYGEIVSSAAYWTAPSGAATVFFGGGGSLFALDAASGALRWQADTDPDDPTSPVEVESSPLVFQPAGKKGAEVLVGTDVNEANNADATGLLAFDAASGKFLWKFDPETSSVIGLDGVAGHGCGDVWSSPTIVSAPKPTVVFNSGNCSNPNVTGPSESVWAVSPRDGALKWVFHQGGTKADRLYGSDDDFGASPIATTIDGRPAVLAASKAAFAYALDAGNGKVIWSNQIAQPGQSGPFAGAIGGVIGSAAIGPAGKEPGLFASSAVPLPFLGAGPDQNGAQPDTNLLANPQRASSLHAIDATTGKVLWQQPLASATYAPVTYANGVVFAPSTTSFAAEAYRADTGQPLWVAPVGASLSSGVAVAGSDIYFGAGTDYQPGQPIPPQATGIWSFAPAGAGPAISGSGPVAPPIGDPIALP
ncbi:MAG: outer membrane protein assembly factor BamB family protein [Acidimicrobiales bacterium]